MQVMTLQQARKIKEPIVYGLTDPADGRIVYVGKTKSPRNRLPQYTSPGACHNAMLAEWLSENQGRWRIAVLERNPADLNAAERRQIRMRRHQTFNLIAGGDEMWRAHVSQPWMAGPGKKCPSDILLTMLKRNGGGPSIGKQAREFRNSMTPRERCLYEVSLAMWAEQEMPSLMRPIRAWLANTSGKMLPIIAG